MSYPSNGAISIKYRNLQPCSIVTQDTFGRFKVVIAMTGLLGFRGKKNRTRLVYLDIEATVGNIFLIVSARWSKHRLNRTYSPDASR